MIWNKIFKYLVEFSKDRKTREKDLIETNLEILTYKFKVISEK